MTAVTAVLALTTCVTGLVSFVAHESEGGGVLEPEGGGRPFWFMATNVVSNTVSVGDRVAVCGEWKDLAFAPGMGNCTVRHLGAGTFATAPERRLAELAGGRFDNVRVRLRGVLTNVRPSVYRECVLLALATESGAFSAHVPQGGRDWDALLDAELMLEGVAASSFNVRREFVGVVLQVPSADAVAVTSASGDPFARPLTPLESIFPYALEGVDLHRRHVRGVVTYAKPGEFLWLSDGEATLRVDTSETAARAGDLVEAVGFATRAYGLGRLTDATVRTVGTAPLPEPIAVAWKELSGYPFDESGHYLNFDGRYVTCEGRVLACVADGLKTELIILREGVQVKVLVDGPLEALFPADVSWGPSVRVTGVLELTELPNELNGPLPAIGGWTIRVASAKGVELVRDAAWRKNRLAVSGRRLLFVLLVLFVVALVVAGCFLIRMRGQKRALDLLACERKRMAADLHDTIEQHLATTRMMLKSAVAFSPNVPDPVRKAVAEADGLLAHAKAEMRARIFNMRSDYLFTQPPERVFRTLAEKMSSHRISVRTRLRGLPERLPETIFSELVFIVQEAITNAVKHGGCRTIVLTSDPSPNGFTLSVANDGEPFDPETALGPEAGHYGLVGMRERAKRANLGLSFVHDGRLMVVRIEAYSLG